MHQRFYNNVQQFLPPYQAQQNVFNPGHQQYGAYHGEPRLPPYWLHQQWAANQFSPWGQSLAQPQIPPQRAASSASMSAPRQPQQPQQPQPQQVHQFPSPGIRSQAPIDRMKKDFPGVDYAECRLTPANYFTPKKPAQPVTVVRMANPAFNQAAKVG